MKKVAAIVRLMSIPMRPAASRSCAVARMALPSFDRSTNRLSETIRTTAIAMTAMSLNAIVAPLGPRGIESFGRMPG